MSQDVLVLLFSVCVPFHLVLFLKYFASFSMVKRYFLAILGLFFATYRTLKSLVVFEKISTNK